MRRNGALAWIIDYRTPESVLAVNILSTLTRPKWTYSAWSRRGFPRDRSGGWNNAGSETVSVELSMNGQPYDGLESGCPEPMAIVTVRNPATTQLVFQSILPGRSSKMILGRLPVGGYHGVVLIHRLSISCFPQCTQ